MAKHRIPKERTPRGDDESISPMANHVTHHLEKADRMSQEAIDHAARPIETVAENVRQDAEGHIVKIGASPEDDKSPFPSHEPGPTHVLPLQPDATRILSTPESEAAERAEEARVRDLALNPHRVNIEAVKADQRAEEVRTAPRSNPPKVVE